MQYLMERRMERASQLLAEERYGIKQVAGASRLRVEVGLQQRLQALEWQIAPGLQTMLDQ